MARYPVKGRVALVTGAAGGIGLEAARALHGRGASVVLTDLDEEATRRAAASIGVDRTLGMAADVTDRGALDAAVAAAVDRFGDLDVVVANAGIAPTAATVRVADDAEYARVIDVDLNGVWNTVRAAIPEIVERRGHMVLVASIYAFTNGMLGAPYAMAKAGVEQLGRALRTELSLHGASAGVAYFGFIDTAMVQHASEDPLTERLFESIPRPLQKRLHPRQAGEAIARGVERRSATIIAPRRWALLRSTRGWFGGVADRYVRGNPELRRLLEQADARRSPAAPEAELASALPEER